jgi:hypothetical protein
MDVKLWLALLDDLSDFVNCECQRAVSGQLQLSVTC